MKFTSRQAYGLGGLVIGVTITDLVRTGWMAIIVFVLTIGGKWLLGKILGTVFDEEIAAAKTFLAINDPVKSAIWNHRGQAHQGKWQHCPESDCHI